MDRSCHLYNSFPLLLGILLVAEKLDISAGGKTDQIWKIANSVQQIFIQGNFN